MIVFPLRRLLVAAVLTGLLAGAVIAALAGRGTVTAEGPSAPALVAADDPGSPREAPAGDPRRPRIAPAASAPRGSGFVQLRLDGPVAIEVRGRDPRGGPDWAVRTFRALRLTPPESRRAAVDRVIGRPLCAQLGRVVGGRFGWIDARNVFRPARVAYGGTPLLCGSRRADTGGKPQLETLTRITDPREGAARALQTVAWGLAGRDARIGLTVRGKRVSLPRTASGAFLVLAKGDVRSTEVQADLRYPSRRSVRLGGDWRAQAQQFRDPAFRGPGRFAGRRRLPVAGAQPTIEARTTDPHGGLPWGIAVVPAQGGGWCLSSSARVIGDRVGAVDYALGIMHDARFDPNDACGSNGLPLTRGRPLNIMTSSGGGFSGEPGQDPLVGRTERRTLRGLSIYSGRALADVVSITIESPRDVRTLLPSRRARAFLAVYDGSFPTGETVLTATFRDGRTKRIVLPSSGF